MGVLRRFVVTVIVTLLAGGAVVGAGAASAATGDYGHQGPSYSGATYVPTSDKPQSKLWYAQGSWYGVMFDTVSTTWHVFRLDRSTQKWSDTGVQVDDRRDTLADALWDGTHLYVASHVVTISSDTGGSASRSSSPARLYRYSFSGGTFSLDAGFPVAINDHSSESLTLDKDSTGTLWATWTKVTASASGGFTAAVYANSTVGNDATWGTPFVLPVTGSAVSQDDLSSVVAFGQNKIGVLWSNQLDGSVYWAVHDDGAARDTWRGSAAIRGNKAADDHLNIKAVQSDASGRVFAVVKTSLDGAAGSLSTDPQLRLLSFKPGTGSWSATTVGTLADCHTRPLLMLDEEHQSVHVLATAPTSGACAYPGVPGTIYDKTASMADPVFAAGRGTPVIRDVANPTMNDVTSTKQSVSTATGLVVLASEKTTQRYWHADVPLTGAPAVAPTASFTASPASGTAPLPVQFGDTSTGGAKSWAWDFGDGTTATTQNPSHTFTAPGTYTVTLTASNAAGTSAPFSQTVTVTAAPTPSGAVSAGASSTALSLTAETAVTIPRPAGVRAGDVLVAQITADGTPTMATVPSGWTSVLAAPLGVSAARVFAYYHVVTDPAAEPASTTWQLSVAQKWGAGMTAFSGVDPAAPFDTAARTKIDVSYASTTLTVPGTTTVTDGAMLIGGVGLDNISNPVTAPSGWAEAWESTGAQVSELAHRQTGTAGPSGDITWTLSKATAVGGWVRALKPLAGAAPVAAPTSSFTSSATTGQVPLPVQFTDTSTESPTSWTWDFGDGTGSNEQHPTHTYSTAGTYTVSLIAGNRAGTGAKVTATLTATPAAVAPTAAFTPSVTTGQAPLPVQFTDASTGNPTAWAWDFGDGGTATTQNPAHTYTAAGTYTVTLTATNTTGASTPARQTVTVTAGTTTPPPAGGAGITTGASTTAVSATAVQGVSIARPTGLRAGDVLITQITADNAPNLSTVPTGWTSVLTAPVSIGGARLFVYSHLVTDPTAEPASYAWQLSAAQKWGALTTAYSGVDTTTVFDTAATTAVDKTYAAAKLTLPGVTTTTNGAVLIGGIGMDSGSAGVTAPTGWTETAEISGGQTTEHAAKTQPTAGPSGTATWTLPKTTAVGGWLRALRPAAGGGTTPVPVDPGPGTPTPSAPTAAFTPSVTTGQAPLPVQFTDASTGNPTAWAWDFGDGGTATTQNPAHTYTAAGTYTVTLTATNTTGASTPARQTVTVTAGTTTPPPAGGAGITTGASTTAVSATAVQGVSIARPTGLRAGDVLITQITADNAPNLSTVPTGWTSVLTAPVSIGGARLFVYSHLVTDPTAEPASYAWQLSAAQKWGALTTAYSGVDTTTVFDTAATTAVDKTYAAAKLTLPGVTTTTNGAVLIGGIGMDSGSAGVTAPTGWTETAEISGGQTTEHAAKTQPTAGPSGTATWTLPKTTAVGGWLRALRPAA
ncbi:PKD domain-containing protein [Modestobacter marinus]|uniref:PKD domain-containing protein n=1 Tax=Modestobacter marinus TaxID=477641 RepID=UPI001C95FF22|nr:PKD domain-containing protein [Modestobacter marinus]